MYQNHITAYVVAKTGAPELQSQSIPGGELRDLRHFRDAHGPTLELNLELHHQRLGALHRVGDVDDLRHRAVASGIQTKNAQQGTRGGWGAVLMKPRPTSERRSAVPPPRKNHPRPVRR